MDWNAFTPGSAFAGGTLIGLAAVLLMAATGRIAGVSGQLSRLLPPYEDTETLARLAFVAGLVASPALYKLATGSDMTHVLSAGYPALVAAGLLVGYGSVTGNGCTSGHGVCGLARFSKRSLAAVATFMATAIATVFLVRHVIGG